MDAADIVRARLGNQAISRQQGEQPGQLVARLGAVQAQDYAGALWAVGLRLLAASAGTEATIEQALAERTIVRTWPMRGTLHFVAAADARWMLRLLTPRVVTRSAGRYRQLELDEKTFAQSATVLGRTLAGGRQGTRPALYQALEQAGISTAGQRGIHILGRHAQDGLLCFGTREGKQHTFVLLDEFLPPATVPSREEALCELTRRYFTGHGPATLRDFMWWSGLTTADVRAGLAMAGDRLSSVVVDGQTYWLADQAAPAPQPEPTAYLLPGFDEYLLGYADRSLVLPAIYSGRVNPGKNGVFISTVVIDGRVAGIWKRRVNKGSIAITCDPFGDSFTGAEMAAIAAAAERFGRFKGVVTSVQ